MEHLDETGAICTRHAPNTNALLVLATIGSRVSSFNHDIASKLQGVMMSLDEIAEYVENDPNPMMRQAVEDAMAALKEATTLLTANRALTRTATKTKSTFRDIVDAISTRFGIAIHGALPEAQLETTIPLLTQALALVLDSLAGTGRARSLTAVTTGDTVVFSSTTPPTPSFADALALAAFAVSAAGGELRCGDDHVSVRLPPAAPK
jgi:hypothetical protein